jgi:predicted dinucleotide-binding enzyme
VEKILEAVGSAEAVVLAIPGGGVEDLLDAYGASLDGKLLLDATNKLPGDKLHQVPLLEARLPAARVFRAFNTLGWENFAEPVIDGEVADLFYSGPDGDDRSAVEELIASVGLRPVYVGAGAEGADILDGVARLWFALALGRGRGRHIAFRTLGLPSA